MKEVSNEDRGSATDRRPGVPSRQLLCHVGRSTRFLLAASAGALVFCTATACVLQADAENTAKTAALKNVSTHDDSSLGDLARDVDAVVLATVIGKRSERTARGANQQPFFSTLVDLEVERAIRGEVGDVITVEQTGGGFSGIPTPVDRDQGSYEIGSRVMLFLKARAEAGHYYVATASGRFDVVENELRAAVPGSRVGQTLDLLPVEVAARIIETDVVSGGVTTCVAEIEGCNRISFQPCCYQCSGFERALCVD